MNIKYKIILFVLFLMAIIGAFAIFDELKYQERLMLKDMELKTEHVHRLIHMREKTIGALYSARLQNIVDSHLVKDFIKNNNLSALRKVLLEKYKFLRREISDIQVLHYIDKNNYSVFRAHEPTIYGDNIGKKRELVYQVNKTKKKYLGYEEGVFNISYRVMLPVIYDGVHYGLIELGFKLDFILDRIKRIFKNDIYMVLLNNKYIEKYKFKKDLQAYNKNYLVFSQDEKLKNKTIDLSKKFIEIDDQIYQILVDDDNRVGLNTNNIMKMIYLYNTTYYIKDLEDKKYRLFFKYIILMIIILIILYFSFTYYEKELNKLYKENQDKAKMLVQQSKLAIMGEMIAMIAHQWKQPLAGQKAIIGGIKLKQRLNRIKEDDIEEAFSSMDLLINHMNNTITDFTNFFKPSKSKNNVSIKTSILESLDMVKVIFDKNRIVVDINIVSDIKLNIYNGEFKQVLLNILNNAKDALIENQIEEKKINININLVKNGVDIAISDNAGGIPNSIIDKIFEPYFSTKAKNGTGLGLYMSKIIIDEHLDGVLSVSNDDNGAIFKIFLPIDK
jgi:signal transduction histidine kinase